METPFSAYHGEDPYVFVCYAHANERIVYPEIEWLSLQGVNIWYDEGISAGRIWRSEVGDAIRNASQVIFYISEASLESDHCSREINFALDELIDVIPIYLEDITLTTDLQVGLGSVQALHREQEPRYRDHLLSAVKGAAHRPKSHTSASSVRTGSRLPMYTMLAAVMSVMVAVAWWSSSFKATGPVDELVNIVIEPFNSESESTIGLEYEIRRLLMTSPGLVARVADGSTLQSGYVLKGEVLDGELNAQLSDSDGQPVSRWEIKVSNKLSLATNTLVRDLLISLGRRVDALPPPDDQISQQSFRAYLRAMAMLRFSHSVENLNTALSGFLEVVDTVPRYAPAHAGLCSTYLSLYLENREKSNIQLAEIHCHRALTLGGQDPKVHSALGMLYRATGQEQKAIDSYKRALELAPYSGDAMIGLAETLVYTGADAEAEQWFQEAIKVDPGHWENYHALGLYRFNQGNFELALEIFQTAFVLAPNEFRILNNIGGASFMIGDYEQAVEYWRQAVTLQPNAAMYANLGTSYFFQREFKLASDMYIEAHNDTPGDYRYLGQIAEANYVGSLGESEKYFQQAITFALLQLEINPDDPLAISNIASYYAGLGDAENAKLFIGRAIKKGSENPDVLYFVTISYARIGDIKMASSTLERLIGLGYERKLVELDANFDGLLAVLENETNI